LGIYTSLSSSSVFLSISQSLTLSSPYHSIYIYRPSLSTILSHTLSLSIPFSFLLPISSSHPLFLFSYLSSTQTPCDGQHTFRAYKSLLCKRETPCRVVSPQPPCHRHVFPFGLARNNTIIQLPSILGQYCFKLNPSCMIRPWCTDFSRRFSKNGLLRFGMYTYWNMSNKSLKLSIYKYIHEWSLICMD